MSDAGTSFSFEEFDRIVDQKLEEKSLNRAKLYRREELLWTALAPSWTVTRAEERVSRQQRRELPGRAAREFAGECVGGTW
jgi:hypothetical protein